MLVLDFPIREHRAPTPPVVQVGVFGTPKRLTGEYRVQFAGASGSLADQSWEPDVATPNVEEAIERSRSICNVADEWGDVGDVPADQGAWDRATSFLRNLTRANGAVPIPSIAPADGGSVDLYWRMDGRTLLVNFPADGDEGTFFGRDTHFGTIGGRVTGEARADIAAWLTK